MKIIVKVKGSATSGNWGHKGVPGQRGGSAPGGGRIMNAAGYLYKKRKYLEAHSPRKQLEEIILAAKPKYNPADVEMMADVMLLSPEQFDHYSERLSIKVPDEVRAAVFTGSKDIDREIARLRWEIEEEATLKDENGSVRLNVYGSEDMYRKLYGTAEEAANPPTIPAVRQKLQDTYNVIIGNPAGVEQSQVDADMSRLYRLAEAYPVVGKLLRGTKIEYADPISNHPNATADYDGPKGVLHIYKGNMPPIGATFIHELMHKAQGLYNSRADAKTGMRDLKIFGKGRTASMYGNTNYDEDFAEAATAMIISLPGIRDWLSADKVKYIDALLGEV